MKKAKISCLLIIFLIIGYGCVPAVTNNYVDFISTAKYQKGATGWLGITPVSVLEFNDQDKVISTNYSQILIAFNKKVKVKSIKIMIKADKDSEMLLVMGNDTNLIKSEITLKAIANEEEEIVLNFDEVIRTESIVINYKAVEEEDYKINWVFKIIEIN